MEIKQALQVIDQVLAQFKGTRQDHLAISEAWQVLNKALTSEEDTK